jgi:hypothetical protein
LFFPRHLPKTARQESGEGEEAFAFPLTLTISINPSNPLKSPGERCARGTADCVILLTFHAFLPILVPFRGILRASPVLSLQPCVFRRIPGVHFTLVTVFPALFPDLCGGCFALTEVPEVTPRREPG